MSILLPKYNKFKQTRTIGEYTIHLPDPPNIELIANKDLPQEKQKFYVTELPRNIESWDAKCREAFEQQEWDRRRNGYWFWNNGNLEYMTGQQYFYVNWWHIDSGLPNFIDSDRDWFYFWDYVEKNPKARGMLYISNRREGKALALDVDIPTPTGWIKMGDIKLGDKVFGSDGKETTVKYVSPIAFNRNCYKITFSDGESIVADEEHLWIVYNKVNRVNIRKGKTVIPQTKTTKQILDTISLGGKESNWCIANSHPIEYSKKELTIPPYIFGIWLGDGSKGHAAITNVDEPIIRKWIEYGESIGLSYRLHDKITHFLTKYKKGESWSKNDFVELLKQNNVYKNKHIPKNYLQSSIFDRIQLLQGLMDTDGTIKKGGCTMEFCSKYEHLANQFHELISSLGIKGRVSSKLNKKYNKYYYYVRFSSANIPCFTLQKHIDRSAKNKGGWNPNYRYITNIESVSSVPVVCIEVSNENSSFLCTKSFITTHNTYKAVSILYETISRTPNVSGGIQSKSNQDSKIVFDKMILGWRKLPYFFKPIDVGESHPKTRLDFAEPSKRDTKNQKKEYGLVLDSYIDFENAKEEAYDGLKQRINIQDEIGKTIESNVHTRIGIVRECVVRGSKVLGKILATSTIEEMIKKGGANCKLVWDESDPNVLLPNGQTQNGLLRYFKPAYCGFAGDEDFPEETFIDEYGYSDESKARKYIQANRDAMKNRDSVNSDRRKYPFTLHDCFLNDSTKTFFDATRLEQQVRYNETIPNIDQILIKGDFQWKDGIKDSEVIWVNNKEGKFLLTWLPPIDKRNKSVIRYGKKAPANAEMGCFGLDPYDSKITVDNRKSDAACYGFRRYDAMDPNNSGLLISEYVHRPALPEQMWESMIMMCVYFGWEILIENNRIGTINYFRMRGYENYLMERPAETEAVFSKEKIQEKGIPMSGEEARMQLLYATESYISSKVGLIEEDGKTPYMGKMYFNKLLQNWIEFDFDHKWTAYDSMVGAGLAILGSRKAMPKKVNQEAIQFFKVYKTNQSGMKDY